MKTAVFEYFDYRKLLKDLYEECKASKPRFSYRSLGQKAGFSSAGYFTKIFQGKTNISSAAIFKFAEAFELSKTETAYFEMLVHFNQATTPSEKQHYFEKIVAMKKSHVKTLEPIQFDLFDKWYYVAIREIMDFFAVGNNYKELGKMVYPPIQAAKAQKAVETLEKLGLIRRNAQGYFERVDAVVSTGDEWESMTIQHFQSEVMDIAKHALYNIAKADRDFSTLSLSISEKSLMHIKDKLKSFRRELLDLAKTDNQADRVYQLNLQLFPLSNIQKGQSE